MKASSIYVTLLALAACGGTRDVAGQVVSGFGRAPVAGAKVRVGSKAIVTTGTDGRFAVQSVDIPYDVAVATPDGASAAVYEGLTRADPVVLISSSAGQLQSIGTINGESATGKLTGGVPLADGSRIQGLFTGPSNASASACCGSVSSDGTYTMPLSWAGDASSFTGTLRVVVFRVDAGNVPVSFDAIGSVPVTIVDGQVPSEIDIPVTAVGSGRVTGTVSLAPGYEQFGDRLMSVFFPPSFGSMFLASTPEAPAIPAYDYPAFSAPGAVLRLSTVARNPAGAIVEAWRAGFSPGQTVDLSVPAAPTVQISSPAAVTSGTTLSWSPIDGAVYTFLAASSDAHSTFTAVTHAASFQIPDLSALGFTWPKSTSFLAGVDASSPRTPDDVAGDNRRPPVDHDGVDASSALAGFTTAP